MGVNFNVKPNVVETKKPLASLPKYPTDVKTQATSYLFRNPEFFRQLTDDMRPQISSNDPQPYFVLSAGCGRGKEPVSIVITWLKVLEKMSVKPEDFPLVVIALDAVLENLEQVEKGEFAYDQECEGPLLQELGIDLEKYFEIQDSGLLQTKQSILDQIYTTQMDLTNGKQVLELMDFTQKDRPGFDAIFCYDVTTHLESMDFGKSKVQEKVERWLGLLLRPGVPRDMYFLHNN